MGRTFEVRAFGWPSRKARLGLARSPGANRLRTADEGPLLHLPSMKTGWLIPCVLAVLAIPADAAASHGLDKDCPDFSSQSAAQYHLNNHRGDPDRLDGDRDGVACDSRPCPCYYGRDTEPRPTPSPTPTPAPSPTPAPTPPARPGPPPDAPTADQYRARVVSVIDGDTIKVRLRSGSQKTVRLIGLDTPESRKPGVAVECGAKSATQYMTRRAFRKRRGRRTGQTVRLTTDPTQDRTDRYGRLLAYANRTVDGVDLGNEMVRAGWGMAYVYDAKPFQRLDSYDAAQTQAKSNGRGVWGACGGDFHSQQ